MRTKLLKALFKATIKNLLQILLFSIYTITILFVTFKVIKAPDFLTWDLWIRIVYVVFLLFISVIVSYESTKEIILFFIQNTKKKIEQIGVKLDIHIWFDAIEENGNYTKINSKSNFNLIDAIEILKKEGWSYKYKETKIIGHNTYIVESYCKTY